MSANDAVQDGEWNDSVCRLCLSKDGNESVFHRGVQTEVDLAERIFQCVSIRISKENPLPVVVCHECIHFVNEWHKFREKCHKMQTVLLSRLKDLLSSHTRPKITSNGLEKPKDTPPDVPRQAGEPKTQPVPPAPTPSDDGCGDSEASSTTAPAAAQQPDEVMEIPDDADTAEPPPPPASQVVHTTDDDQPPALNGDVGGETNSVLKRALEQNREDIPRSNNDDDDEIECVSSETMGMSVDSSEATNNVEATPEPVRTQGLIKPKSWSSSKIRIESTVTLPLDDRGNESRTESDMDRTVDSIPQAGSSGFNQSRSMDMSGLISLANVKAEPEDDYSDSFDAQSAMSDDDVPRIKQEDDGMGMDMDFNNLEVEFDMANLSARDLADICRLRGDDTVSIKGIKCLICRHKFSSLHSLLRHTSSQTHLIAKDFTAKMKSGLLTPAAIALHNKRMLAFKNKANRKRVPGGVFMKSKITCRTCNRAFISKRELLRHEEYYKHGSFHPMVRPRNPPLLPALNRPGQMNVIQIQRPPLPLQSLQQRQFGFQSQQMHVQPQQPSQANILSAQFRLTRPQVTIQPAVQAQMEQREYICPIPNCNYICTEGSVLLTHMTSHGINQKAQQLPGGASIQRKIIPQQPQQGNPYALQYRPPPQNRSRPTKPTGPPPTRDFYCPFHHVYFNSARGYLNHARVCRRCPPLPPVRRTAASANSAAQQQQLAQQLVQNHLKQEPDQTPETNEQRPTSQESPAKAQPPQSSPSQEEQQPRSCKLCNLRFASHQIFLNHMQAYHKKTESATPSPQAIVVRPKSQPPPLSQKVLAQVKLGRKWACNVCNKVFNFSYALKYHMKVHQSPSVPTCKVCKQTFNTMKTCLSHLKTHFLPPSSKLFFCTSCHKAYGSRSEIAKHRYEGLCSMDETSLKVTAYTCNSCEASFDTLEGLNQHKIDQHGGSTAEPGGEPGKEGEEAMEEDGEEGVEGEEQEAQEGDEDVANEGEGEGGEPSEDQPTEADAASVTPSKESELQAFVPTYCKPCDKSFSTYQNLKRHCKTSHNWSENKIKEMISTYAPLDIKSEPTEDGGDGQTPGQSAYSCEFCNATFTLRRILTLHVNNFCHNSPSRPRCDRCGEPVMKNKPCENCLQLDEQMQGDPDQEMAQDDSYNQGDDHQPSFMYKCPIGNMSFMDESAMVQHYSYCTGNCPALFKCAKCNAEFKYKKSFEAHHCGYSRKPTRYHCTDCNRTFSRKNYLLNHKPKCPGYPLTVEEQHLQQQQQRAAAQRSSSSAFPRHFMAPAPTQSIKKTRQSGPVDDDDLGADAPVGTETGSADLVSHACPECPKVFFCQKALIGHEYVHKGTPEDPMFCRFCGKQNMLLEQLYTHTYKCLKSLFRTEEILSCDQCNLAMSRYEIGKELAAKVNKHVLSCYPIPFYPGEEIEGGEKLLCYLCCHAFATPESLATHKISHKSHLKSRYRRTSPFLKPLRKRPRIQPPSSALNNSSSSANASGPSTPTSKADFDPNELLEEDCVSENETTSVASSSDVTSSTDLSCGVCGRRFATAEKLKSHEKVHDTVQDNVYDEEDDDEDLEEDGDLEEADPEGEDDGPADAENEGEGETAAGEGDDIEEEDEDEDEDEEEEGEGDADDGEPDAEDGDAEPEEGEHDTETAAEAGDEEAADAATAEAGENQPENSAESASNEEDMES